MFKSKSTTNCEKGRKSNANGSNDMIRLQLPNNSSSNNTSTEPLTPPTTPLQPQQQNQAHSNNTYRLASSQASSTGLLHNSHFTASSSSIASQNLLLSSNSEVPLSEQATEEPLRSSRLGQFQESPSVSDYYNCNGAIGNISHSYWDGRTNSLSVIPAITSTSLSEMHKGFVPNLSSPPCDNQLVQIGSPQCKGTPSPPHTSPNSLVGQITFPEKNQLDPSTIDQHLVTEANFNGISSHQDSYSSSYASHSHYSPHYPYFNSYYNQGSENYHHPSYTQHNFHSLHHSPDSIPPQLQYLNRKVNSNSTSPGSSVSTDPSLSPSSGTVGSATPMVPKHKLSDNRGRNLASNSQSVVMMGASSSINPNRLNGHKLDDDTSWPI